jgi:hypothetical protein
MPSARSSSSRAGVHGAVVVHGQEPTADAALVAGQKEAAAHPGQAAHGFGRAGDEGDQVRVAQVVALFDQRSVAVEKDSIDAGHVFP